MLAPRWRWVADVGAMLRHVGGKMATKSAKMSQHRRQEANPGGFEGSAGAQDLLRRTNRNTAANTCANRGTHFRLCCLILALLVAILSPTCRNIAPTSTKQRHLGANIAQNSRQDAPTTPSNHPKTSKNLKKPMVFQCFLISSASAKLLQKCTKRFPK